MYSREEDADLHTPVHLDSDGSQSSQVVGPPIQGSAEANLSNFI